MLWRNRITKVFVWTFNDNAAQWISLLLAKGGVSLNVDIEM